MPHSVRVGNAFKKATQTGALRFRNKGNALKSILIVGGVEECDDGILCEDDSLYLVTLLQCCFDLGLSIRAPETVTISNLRYGDDFLKDKTQADIVLFANIFHHPHHYTNHQSPLAHQQGAWQSALEKSNLKVLGNVSGMGMELPTHELTTDEQSCLSRKIYKMPSHRIDVLMR